MQKPLESKAPGKEEWSSSELFELAGTFVRDGGAIEMMGGKNFSTTDKLQFYGWFKQATEGDCDIPQPSVFKVELRAKWGAWNAMLKRDPDDCRSKYLAKLSEAIPAWLSWAMLEPSKQKLVAQRPVPSAEAMRPGRVEPSVQTNAPEEVAGGDRSPGTPSRALEGGVESTDPEKMFDYAVAFVQQGGLAERIEGGNLEPASEQELHALYKQATEGKCTEQPPALSEGVQRAKWLAWSGLGEMSKRDARKGYAKAVSRLAPGWLAWPQLAGVARTRDRTPAEVVRKLDLSAGSAPSAAGPRQWRDQADEAWGRASAAPTVPDEPAGQSPEPSPRVNILDSEPDQVSGGATLQSSLPQKPPHNESLSSVLRFAAVVHLCLLLIIAWSVAARLLPFNPPPHVALLNALRECKQLLSPVPLASFLTSSASGFATACAAEGAIATCFAAVIFVVCSFACLRSAALEEWAVVSRALQSCYAQQRELAQQLLEARVLNQQLLQRIEEVTPASTPVAMSPAPASVAASAQTTGEAHNVAAAPQTRPSRGYGSPAPLLATPARGAGTDGAAAPSVPVTPAAVTLKGWGRDGFVFESPGGGPRMCLKLMPQT